MQDKVRTDILYILNSSLKIIERDDISSLGALSNNTIHNASIFQDEDSINIAIAIYTIYKIFNREHKVDYRIVRTLTAARDKLEKNNVDGYKKAVRKLLDYIYRKDHKMRHYIEHVIETAKVKKGTKIYDHGVSLAQSAQLLGVNQWEMMNYIGNIKEPVLDKTDVRKRLAFARGLFK